MSGENGYLFQISAPVSANKAEGSDVIDVPGGSVRWEFRVTLECKTCKGKSVG